MRCQAISHKSQKKILMFMIIGTFCAILASMRLDCMDLAFLFFCRLTLAFAFRQKRLHDANMFLYSIPKKIRNGPLIMIFSTNALGTTKTRRQMFSKCHADLSHDRYAVRTPVSLRVGSNTSTRLLVAGMMRAAIDGTNSSCE